METSRTNQSSGGPRPAWVIDSASIYSKMKEYDGLMDTNLRSYFSSKRRRRLLVRAGLLTTMGVREKKNTEPSPVRGRDSKEKLLEGKKATETAKTPGPNRNVYSSPNRSRSVRVTKTVKPISKKPVTHAELQHIFEKYRQKVIVPETTTHLPPIQA